MAPFELGHLNRQLELSTHVIGVLWLQDIGPLTLIRPVRDLPAAGQDHHDIRLKRLDVLPPDLRPLFHAGSPVALARHRCDDALELVLRSLRNPATKNARVLLLNVVVMFVGAQPNSQRQGRRVPNEQ